MKTLNDVKTLEQFLDEAYTDENGITSTPNIINAVRKYLTQFREKWKCLTTAEGEILVPINDILDKLEK